MVDVDKYYPQSGKLFSCGAAIGTCTIQPDGTVIPCDMSEAIKGGNIRENSFWHVWQSSEVLCELRSFRGMDLDSEKLIIGKVENSNLEDLWKHHPLLLDLRKTVPDKLEGVCSICIHKTECMGFCRTVEFIKTGSFTTPYSWCQNVFDSGLFPENRLFFTNLRGS